MGRVVKLGAQTLVLITKVKLIHIAVWYFLFLVPKNTGYRSCSIIFKNNFYYLLHHFYLH